MLTFGGRAGLGMSIWRLGIVSLVVLVLYSGYLFALPGGHKISAPVGPAAFTPPQVSLSAFASLHSGSGPEGQESNAPSPPSSSRESKTKPAPKHSSPSPPASSDHSPPSSKSHSWRPIPDQCMQAPGGDRVMLLLKTGATELYQKLPFHFSTTLKCVPNFLIVSDMEHTIAEHVIFDAIAPVSAYRKQHQEFELYRQLQQARKDGRDPSEIQREGAWMLDKWKFLPMLHKAFEVASDTIDWFVIIEADTSLSWTNLLQVLQRLDHTEPVYLGAEDAMGASSYAQGGAGIVLSREALRMLEDVRNSEGAAEYDARWEKDTSEHCCGDEILSRALLEAGVWLDATWPLFQSETLSSIDWTNKHWCSPAVSWHHATPFGLSEMWQFERAWIDGHGWREPYLYRNVFAHFIAPQIATNRSNWNNLSADKKFTNPQLDQFSPWETLKDFERAATESQDACAQACLHPLYPDCTQWMYLYGRCHLGNSLKYGMGHDEEWVSGWIPERIESMKYEHSGCVVQWTGGEDQEVEETGGKGAMGGP